MSDGETILYYTEDGQAEIQHHAVDGTVWLSQMEMAELFQTTEQNISLHVRNILGEGELDAEATVKEYLTVQTEGKQQVRRPVIFYRLEMVLAVGYRVRSPRGTQFRRCATDTLREYLVKGFFLNDDQLKDPAWDYFDELLERIRDIQVSEAMGSVIYRFRGAQLTSLAHTRETRSRNPASTQDANLYGSVHNPLGLTW